VVEMEVVMQLKEFFKTELKVPMISHRPSDGGKMFLWYWPEGPQGNEYYKLELDEETKALIISTREALWTHLTPELTLSGTIVEHKQKTTEEQCTDVEVWKEVPPE